MRERVGDRMKSGNDNIYYIPKSKVPSNKKLHTEPSYATIVHLKTILTESASLLEAKNYLTLRTLDPLQRHYLNQNYFLIASFTP